MSIIVFVRKVNKTLRKITILLTLILILANIGLFSYSSEKAAQYTCNVHFKNAMHSISSHENLLKAITEKVSTNKNIITLLKNNPSIDSFSEEDKFKMIAEIDHFEGVINTLSFIRTVNIVSLQGKYLFSNKTLYDNFDLTKRPWFKSEFLITDTNDNVNTDTIISRVHENFTNKAYTVSIIQFIYSEGQTLGAVILDIYLEDFLRELNSSFSLGELNCYIAVTQDTYISENGLVTANEVFSKNNLIYEGRNLNDETDIIFAFNKDSLIYNQFMKQVNRYISLILVLVGVLSCFIFLRLIKKTLNPIMSSLDKLKVLLKNLEKNNFHLELTDEFQQLELISESLSKSFDEKIQSLIYHDELTSLPNRKMLLKLCNELIKNKKKLRPNIY